MIYNYLIIGVIKLFLSFTSFVNIAKNEDSDSYFCVRGWDSTFLISPELSVRIYSLTSMPDDLYVRLVCISYFSLWDGNWQKSGKRKRIGKQAIFEGLIKVANHAEYLGPNMLYIFRWGRDKDLAVMMAVTALKLQSLSVRLQQLKWHENECCYGNQLIYMKVKPILWTFTHFYSLSSITISSN